jgi:hypothetical protein
MPRVYWKGYLRLSLVTCPIELFPATSQAEKTHFHQINTGTGHRLRQVDEQTGRVVDTEHKGLRNPRSYIPQGILLLVCSVKPLSAVERAF